MKVSVGSLHRSLDVFEALINGGSLAHVAERFGISESFCHRLSSDARLILSHSSSAWGAKRTPDPLQRGIAADRLNKAFWAERIAIARARIRPCDQHQMNDCQVCRVFPTEFLRLNFTAGSTEDNQHDVLREGD